MATEQDVDRLSALPDGVICHILSFMPTKLSVKTSILARRWRFLWAHVPILDLHSRNYSSQRTSFGGIVCELMMRHKVERLTTFRLSYYDDDDDFLTGCYELETCIATAIERNVQILDLYLAIELPRCVLTCKTLVDLRLDGGVSIPSSGPIYLPNLKKLYFHTPEYDVQFTRLVSSCPVLEELIIDRAPCLDLEGCTLSSSTLKSLTTHFSCYNYACHIVKINTPALRYLKVHGYMYDLSSVSLMNSLIEADICFENCANCSSELLDAICNVKCLKLSCFPGQMPASIVKFGSLTRLQLTANWCFLKMFIASADHLQELIFHERSWHSAGWMDPIEEGCACLLHSLRTVRIDDFACTEEGFNMVRYILRNAQVLKRMEIYCPRDLQKKFDVLQRISSFCRGSKECELVFC